MKKTTRKKTRKNPAAKNSFLVKRTKLAVEILDAQKKDYKKMLSENIKNLGFEKGLESAVGKYRSKYGKDAKDRWEHAQNEAEGRLAAKSYRSKYGKKNSKKSCK